MASAVLQHVTTKKLAKLAESQTRFEQQRVDLLSHKRKADTSLDYSRHLLDGIKKIKASPQSNDDLANLNLFLKQAQHDASVPPATLAQWQKDLENVLDVRQARYAYASLFGRLVTEWLENPNEANKQLQKHEPRPQTEAMDTSDGEFEPVGRAEMHEQRKTWESFAFDGTDEVDETALRKYLTNLFGSEEPVIRASDVTPFDNLRKVLGYYRVKPIRANGLKSVISGLIRSDLFAGPKRDALLDLKERPAVLAEMVDVLNMEIKNLQHWEWESSAVPVVQRRQVNGKYRFFMDEEIHQAILIEYIGSDLAAKLKTSFTTFYSRAFVIFSDTAMTEQDLFRRAYYLQQINTSNGAPRLSKPNLSVAATKATRYYNDYFLVQMPDVPGEGARNYAPDEPEDNDFGRKSPVQLKQELLENLTTDVLLQLKDQGAVSILQSDFKWFGPSLPHKTILTVLRFLGIRENLLKFFETFLKAPIVFAQDGPGAIPRNRAAGVPMSHALSDAMSEAVLFCLDFAVNKATAGDNLIRLHDDLWFWGSTKNSEIAWKAIQDFTKVTGLQLNEEKTGSVCLGSARSSLLPTGRVRWGFLVLDPSINRWVIDRTQVDTHITELRLQLDACRSVFAFVQAWNSYVSRFFTTNFGRACNCHGPDHLNAVIATFEHIQRELFPSGSVTAHVKDVIEQRFGVSDIPAGFLYFPIELGGLDLRNPFIPLLSRLAYESDDPDLTEEERLQSSHNLKPEERLALAELKERQEWETARRAFDERKAVFLTVHNRWRPSDHDTFFGFDEYVRFRTETSRPLLDALAQLLEQPAEVSVSSTPQLEDFVRQASDLIPGSVTVQLRWILALYGPEVVQKFGRLCIGDRELLPVGLVNVMRAEKVRWLG